MGKVNYLGFVGEEMVHTVKQPRRETSGEI